MKQATHTGICQWCGARQKLPGGLMAKHGYSVRHGFFSGTCYGSGHMPYEVSCALIQQSVDQARSSAEKARASAAAVVQDALDANARSDESAVVWHHVYHARLSRRTTGSVYLWQTVHLLKGERGELYFMDPQNRRSFPWGMSGELKRIRLEGAKGYSAFLLKHATELDEYVARQERRLADWAPRDLEPVA